MIHDPSDQSDNAFAAGKVWRRTAAPSTGIERHVHEGPDEIAEMVVLLLSSRSGVVTGSVIDWDQIVIGGLD